MNLIETVREALRGRREAVGELYARFAPLVRAAAFDRTGDYHAACDIVQEVFVVVMKDLRRLKDPEKFRPWLMGIARRKAVDHIRRLDARRKGAIGLEEEVRDRSHFSESEKLLVRLHRAITGLPEKERLAIELFHLESLPASQVMEILEMPRSSVYALLIRARKELKNMLDSTALSEDES
jgi:RNA polymerase sigma-70 factor (ECF subfamily)